MTAKISLAGVAKRFGSKVVLDGVDLDVAPGESMVIIGGSGTGKSVLIKCILGLIAPDAGSTRLAGQDVVGLHGSALGGLRSFAFSGLGDLLSQCCGVDGGLCLQAG